MKSAQIIKSLVALILVVLLCIITIIPAFAAVTWYTALYSANASQGNVPYPYTDWYSLLYEYYTYSEGSVYYFEVQNTELGGTQYAPDSIQWQLAYGAYQTGWGDVDLVYRFYVPYYNAAKSWDFQIRTSTGLVVVDSSNLTLHRHSINANVGYYEFTLDRNATGFSDGWYFYSNEDPPVPLDQSLRSYIIQFDYYYNNQIVGTKQTLVSASSNLVSVPIPQLPNYIIIGAEGQGTYGNGNFIFSSVYQDEIVNVQVYSFDAYLEEEYQRGYDRGKTEGLEEGIIQGYQEYKNTPEYLEALDNAFQSGWNEAIESGESGAYPPITNPLNFVMTPVVQFLQIELFPGLEIGTLFLASIAVSLIVIFLKLFAGG